MGIKVHGGFQNKLFFFLSEWWLLAALLFFIPYAHFINIFCIYSYLIKKLKTIFKSKILRTAPSRQDHGPEHLSSYMWYQAQRKSVCKTFCRQFCKYKTHGVSTRCWWQQICAQILDLQLLTIIAPTS